MKTLAKKYPNSHEKLIISGFPAIAKMMTFFYRCVDLDFALGYNGASNQWFRGVNIPSRMAEMKAQRFLDNSQTITTKPMEPVTKAEPEPAKKDEAVSTTYLLVCPQGAEAKVQKVLGLMGCEVVEI